MLALAAVAYQEDDERESLDAFLGFMRDDGERFCCLHRYDWHSDSECNVCRRGLNAKWLPGE
jgi:hypothetical protein